MQTELVAIESVIDLSPASSLLQERKGKEQVINVQQTPCNLKRDHKHSNVDSGNKDYSVSISLISLIGTTYITTKRFQCVKVDKS